MADRQPVPVKKVAARSRAPRKKAAAKKTNPLPKKSPARRTPSKRAAKKVLNPPPAPKPPEILTPSEAVERFLTSAELVGVALVKAATARQLAARLADPMTPPQTIPAMARELREELAGIMRKDEDQHDDWTTRTAGSRLAQDRDTPQP